LRFRRAWERGRLAAVCVGRKSVHDLSTAESLRSVGICSRQRAGRPRSQAFDLDRFALERKRA
jgi:hypothetical protein